MSDTVYFTFGRMNPPNRGHESLINKIVMESSRHGASHLIILSRKCNHHTDPLDFWTRYRYLKMVEPSANIHPSTMDRPDFFSWLKFLADADTGSYKNLVLVGGTDRAKMWYDLALKYNGSKYCYYNYTFENISMIEVPREEGISSQFMRVAALADNYNYFKELSPKKITEQYRNELYEDTRVGLRAN